MGMRQAVGQVEFLVTRVEHFFEDGGITRDE
jgi:hypothetical protein